MTFFSRLKNLYKLSEYEVVEEATEMKGYLEEKIQNSPPIVKRTEAVFVPYQKTDPVKEITQEQA